VVGAAAPPTATSPAPAASAQNKPQIEAAKPDLGDDSEAARENTLNDIRPLSEAADASRAECTWTRADPAPTPALC
jgi:hypothetical protein